MSEVMPTVFVVDDDYSVRESIALLIESAGWVVEKFQCAKDFLARPRSTAPSCLVLDLVLPDINGCDVQAMIADRADLPVIFISGHGDVQMSVRAMKAGALEFFTKPLLHGALLESVRRAIKRSTDALEQDRQLRTLRERYEALSTREREVMALVVAGHANKQVGSDLGISEITVKAHRGQLMRKMGAGSICELVRMSLRLRVGPALDGRPSAGVDRA